MYGNYKVQLTRDRKFRRQKMSEIIKQNKAELLSIIVNHSKYPLDWLLRLDILDFYTHVRLIEKTLKAK